MSFFVDETKLYETIKKADSGDFEAQYLVACHILKEMELGEYDRGMVEKALDYLKNVSINGAYYGLAALTLGDLYYDGSHVPQNYRQAIVWFRTALQANCTPAYYNLGLCFYYGNGVDKDYAKAFDSFVKGSIDADMSRIMLGDMYRKGEFVERDEAFAMKVYKTAYDDTVKTQEKIGVLGDPYGILSLRLGDCYLSGTGVKKNVSEANKYFEQAKKQSENTCWGKPNGFDAETVRLLHLMNAAPYPEDYLTYVSFIENEPDCDSLPVTDLIDLTKENLSDYKADDYLKAYLSSVRHVLTNQGSGLTFYRNMTTAYPHLQCFESDQVFLNKCQRKIDKYLEEEMAIDESED